MSADALWRTVTCSRCDGHGLVSVYSGGGLDFEGAGECRDCGGGGRLFIRPSGRLFQYPGGPAAGSWPGAYATALPRRAASVTGEDTE